MGDAQHSCPVEAAFERRSRARVRGVHAHYTRVRRNRCRCAGPCLCRPRMDELHPRAQRRTGNALEPGPRRSLWRDCPERRGLWAGAVRLRRDRRDLRAADRANLAGHTGDSSSRCRRATRAQPLSPAVICGWTSASVTSATWSYCWRPAAQVLRSSPYLLAGLLLSTDELDINDLSNSALPLFVGDVIGIAVVTPLMLRLSGRWRELSQAVSRPLVTEVDPVPAGNRICAVDDRGQRSPQRLQIFLVAVPAGRGRRGAAWD